MRLKSRVLPVFLTKKKTMQKKLFRYMFILAAILLSLLAAFLFLFGRFDGTEDNLYNTLSLQAEVFDRDITTYYNTITAKSITLSKNTSAFTERYLKNNNISFSQLNNSIFHIEKLESECMDILSQELLKIDCSGAFIMFNTSRTADNKNSKAGVYIQRDMLGSVKQDAMLLYRGTASIGKEKGIMPHRKWNLEFKKDGFPNYDKIFDSEKKQVEYSARITDIIVLPGMSEKIMLVAVPIKSKSGETLGICGFEVSESLFKQKHAQPTTLQHLTCVFSRKSDGYVACNDGFSCGIENGYFFPANGNLKSSSLNDKLKLLKNKHNSFVGITADLPLCIENNDYEITVMMPKTDYNSALMVEFFQTILIILLLVFAAVILCGYFSKKYITPVIKGLNNLKQPDSDNQRCNISEIDEVFDYFTDKSKEYEQSIEDLNKKNEKLSYDRKSEISPDDYRYFLTGLKTLTPSEKNIFDSYLQGKTIKQIAEENNIKEATVKFHNHNIYEKLGVTSKKELLRFAVAYLQNDK